jgi:hypothetical protein
VVGRSSSTTASRWWIWRTRPVAGRHADRRRQGLSLPFIGPDPPFLPRVCLLALYFLLAGSLSRIWYLNVGLAGVLVFVGGKMLLAAVIAVPIGVSLAVVALLLGASVGASLLPVHTGRVRSPARTPRTGRRARRRAAVMPLTWWQCYSVAQRARPARGGDEASAPR